MRFGTAKNHPKKAKPPFLLADVDNEQTNNKLRTAPHYFVILCILCHNTARMSTNGNRKFKKLNQYLEKIQMQSRQKKWVTPYEQPKIEPKLMLTIIKNWQFQCNQFSGEVQNHE